MRLLLLLFDGNLIEWKIRLNTKKEKMNIYKKNTAGNQVT